MFSPAPLEGERPAGAMRYRCRHVTRYSYGEMVTSSHLLAHLAPRPHPRQTGRVTDMTILPWPASLVDRLDWFGNPTTYASIQTPHRELTVTVEMEMQVLPPPPLNPAQSACWEQVALQALERAETVEFVQASPRVPPPDAAITAFVTPFFPPGQPAAAGAMALMRHIFSEFSFDPTATTVSTPIAEVLTKQRGVCQDFAHLMIAALRALGLPARYVSGYLRTLPPPGQERLRGADASHAWVQVWCGEGTGWIDLDPTNGRQADTDHVTLAWGRDYDDVSPLRGVILGGGSHGVLVAVDVEPL
ncbi:Transglutaminase-like enzyme, putative cysteine protease [Azospirillum sp. RU38E]|nr:Transglutaminase-like enzyme, putative cysteine protease [Azospirillum sp. RU38E]SNS57729.1 Transglutaminase-like enzyme, putative cysteine protease [Azospirillum sp. RU37A]